MKKSTTSVSVSVSVQSAHVTAPQLPQPVIPSPTPVALRHAGSITKRALSARTARRRLGIHTRPQRLPHTARPVSSNYAPRVLAGQFEPTALRARQIAADRGQSLHELAHELGYAPTPPHVRTKVDLAAHTRTEIASRTGYSISDISRLFARRHPPTLTKLAKVAAVYGAWLDDMLTALGW